MVNNHKLKAVRAVKDRNRIAGPWEPLVQCQVPADLAKANIIALFQNNRYTVYVKTHASTEFLRPDGTATQVVHLIVARHDKKPVREWGDLQRIKNEVCGPMCEAVELFPSEMRRLDIPSHQTHLWVYEPTVTLPHGLVPKEMHAAMHAQRVASRIPPEARNVFVVFRKDEAGAKLPAEVYGDEAEARAIYGEKLDGDGAREPFQFRACPLDTIPPPDFQQPEGAVGATWTEAARAKHAAFIEVMVTALARPEQLDAMVESEMESLPDGDLDEAELEFSGESERKAADEAEAEREKEAAVSLEAERERLRAERKAREG